LCHQHWLVAFSKLFRVKNWY